jgi:EAL domain-containing protein (putative c-di-GMP-specific phosphodiesterase class I)
MFKLVCGIVILCRELDAMVVAEGIETPTELEAVIESGARFGQGYLLARPAYPPPEVNWPSDEAIAKAQAQRKKTPTKRPR